jgi:hypothetical protein
LCTFRRLSSNPLPIFLGVLCISPALWCDSLIPEICVSHFSWVGLTEYRSDAHRFPGSWDCFWVGNRSFGL